MVIGPFVNLLESNEKEKYRVRRKKLYGRDFCHKEHECENWLRELS